MAWLGEDDSTTLVEDDFSDFDEFESAPTSDEIETVAPVTESKVHPAHPSEKTQREPATTHEQNSGNGPVVRKLNWWNKTKYLMMASMSYTKLMA